MFQKFFKDKLRLLKKSIISRNLDIICVSAFGSYNYNLNFETSDMDFKLVYVPTLEDLLNQRKQSEIVNLGNIGDCELIALPYFINCLKMFDLCKFEVLFAQYISVEEKHAKLFEDIKECAKLMIMNNKLSFADSVLTTSDKIYKTFINNKLNVYNAKKAYNIPRLKLLLNSVIFADTYELTVDVSTEEGNEIKSMKLGNVERDDVRIITEVIIKRIEEMKQDLSDNGKMEFESKLDDLVKIEQMRKFNEAEELKKQEMKVERRKRKAMMRGNEEICRFLVFNMLMLGFSFIVALYWVFN